MNSRNENTCVCCGESIPEGRQVCPLCESGLIAQRDEQSCYPCDSITDDTDRMSSGLLEEE